MFNGRVLQVSMIIGVATPSQYRRRGYMHELMEVVLDACEHTELITLIQTESPALYEEFGFKKIYRFFNRENGMAEADYICMADEVVDDTQPLEICDPVSRWKKKTMENFYAVELLKPIFINGELVYDLPDLKEIRTNCGYQISTLWPEVKRFDNPHNYYVDLSPKLMELKDKMLEEAGK
jgi:nicotinate phosphoribosyltransferase